MMKKDAAAGVKSGSKPSGSTGGAGGYSGKDKDKAA